MVSSFKKIADEKLQPDSFEFNKENKKKALEVMKNYPKNNILLIHMDFSKFPGTVTDHYRSFAEHGRHHYRAFVPDLAQTLIEHGFCDRLNSFDAIVLHYSIYYPEFKANYPKLVEFLSKFENHLF